MPLAGVDPAGPMPPLPILRDWASAKHGGLTRALGACSYSDAAYISTWITASCFCKHKEFKTATAKRQFCGGASNAQVDSEERGLPETTIRWILCGYGGLWQPQKLSKLFLGKGGSVTPIPLYMYAPPPSPFFNLHHAWRAGWTLHSFSVLAYICEFLRG